MNEIEQKITASQALLMQSKDPIAEATRFLYEAVNMLLFRVRDIDDNVKRMIYAMPISTETCCHEPKYDSVPFPIDFIPQEIKDAAWAVQMWMENNGHKKWKLFGIQSRED